MAAPTDIVIASGGSIFESAFTDSVVARFSAVDADAGDTFTWTLVSNPSGAFRLAGSTLLVAAAGILDFETAPTLPVEIKVRDSQGNEFTKTITINVVDANEIVGTPGADDLATTLAIDHLIAGDGDDVIRGVDQGPQPGRDLIEAGAGNDIVIGGAAEESIDGGIGNDLLYGGGGLNRFFGREGDDVLDNTGATVGGGFLSGGDGNDTLRLHVVYPWDNTTPQRSEQAQGGAGDDRILNVGPGDIVDAGDGNDLVIIAAVAPVVGMISPSITLGAGRDTIAFDQHVTPTSQVAATVNGFITGAGGDVIDLTSILGKIADYTDGDPFASGGLLLTQSGADTLLEVPGAETVTRLLTLRNTTATAFTADNFKPSFTSQTITGTAGDDELFGTPGSDTIDGGAGNDFISGAGSGNDTLIGGDGDDHLEAGYTGYNSGDDTLIGGNGNDRITNVGLSGVDTVNAGAGNDLVGLAWFGSVAGSSVVSLGSGRDVVSIGYYPYGGGPTPEPSIVTDFATGPGGDIVDFSTLSRTLGIAATTNPFSTGHVRLTQSGADTVLEFDADAGGTFYNPTTLIRFENRSVAQFTADNFGQGYAPNGSAPSTVTAIRTGTSGDDLLISAVAGGELQGLGGNDVLLGSTFDDTISGGEGNDLLVGNGGVDTIFGGPGNDQIDGSNTSGVFDGGAGNDSINIYDTSGNVAILGGDGNDEIYVYNFSQSSSAAANIDAGAGDDAVYISRLATVTLGSGRDSISPSAFYAGEPGLVLITDFTPGAGGDVVDLANLQYDHRAIADGANPFRLGDVRLVADGADTVLHARVRVFVSDEGGGAPPAAATFEERPIVRFVGVQPSQLTVDNFVVRVWDEVTDTAVSYPADPTVAPITVAPVLPQLIIDGQTVPEGTTTETGPIVENSTVIATLGATNPDGGAAPVITITGPDADKVTFDPVTGVVSSIGAPNFEIPTDANGDRTYELTVTLTDGATSRAYTLRGVTQNVGEATITSVPAGQTGALSAAEGTTAVGSIGSSHPDNAPIYYALFGADASKFAISATGELSFLAAPDFEAPSDVDGDNVYEVTVTVSEAQAPTVLNAADDVRNVRITVTDVAEGPNYITGTNNDDFLVGLAGPDFVIGLGGNDMIVLGAGNDRAYGGDGNDDIRPGAGNDIVYGESGQNTVSYADAAGGIWVDLGGRYVLETAGGRSLLSPAGATYVSTDYIFDIWGVEGSAFDDRFYGTAADEGFAPGAGTDIVYSGGGNDILAYFNALGGVWIEASNGSVLETTGGASLRGGFSGATVVSTDYTVGFSTFAGSDFDDRFYGSVRADTFIAVGGSDIAYGGDGLDTISYAWADGAVYIDVSQRYANETALRSGTLNGGTTATATDLFFGFENATGSDFGDRIFGDGSANVLTGLDGDDIVYAGEATDALFGNAGSDLLSGEAGNDAIDGGTGDDFLIGGLGNDSLTGGTGADRFMFNAAYGSAFGADTITDLVLSEGDMLDLRGHGLGYGDLVFSNVTGGVELSAAGLGVGNTITILGIAGPIDDAHIIL